MRNTVITIIVIVAVAAVVYWLVRTLGPSESDYNPTPSAGTATESANAVNILDQAPGASVNVSLVTLTENGFVVIHTDNNGAPGQIVAASSLMQTGALRDVVVAATLEDGTYYHAMLHQDDGDGVFDPSKDSPMKDSLGNTIMMRFKADSKIEYKG